MRATGDAREARAAERERDAGAALRELLAADDRRAAPGVFGFFGSGSSSTPVSFLRPSSERRSASGRSAWACFISSHGIDSS